MNIEDFRQVLHDDMENASNVSGSSNEDEFLRYVTGILAEAEEFEDFVECHYEGLSRRKGNMRIDGYSFDDTDDSCCIFINYYIGPNGTDTILSEDIKSLFKKIQLFVEESTSSELYQTLAIGTAIYDFAQELYYSSGKVHKFRFYLLTDAYNRQRARTLSGSKILGKQVDLNVWDISRIFDLVRSSVQKESVEILLSDFDVEGISCVQAVDYKDVLIDTDVIPVENEASSSNRVSYKSYLAVIPGTILSELYLEYGSKLLEGNVRSFLSVRGKINKGIQSTIKNYPEMFFAYNNGIAATASYVETSMTDKGLLITKIKDLQIVNGGQTTASIANAVLTAKKGENVQLDNIFVPMKLSVLDHESAEKIIPKISQYSNSQNPVAASDFFSNHPFHIRMEDFSRKTATPSASGNQFQQFWFYERARGQYNQGKMKLHTKTQLKQYSDRFPEKQVITMLDFAKYMELYFSEPHIVSMGRQKTLQVFADKIKNDWERSDTQFNLFYYKRLIALAIIYKHTDELIKQSEWYKTTKSYKANVVAYAISILFYTIHSKRKGYEMDFIRIWNEQDTYDELDEQIQLLSYEVYKFITGPRETENVTQWCKKSICWERAKEHEWTINSTFLNTLIPESSLKNIDSNEKSNQKIANEVNSLNDIIARGSDYWKSVLEWGISRHLLTEKEKSIITMIINMNITGRIPSDAQMNVVLKARARLISEGMPMQF